MIAAGKAATVIDSEGRDGVRWLTLDRPDRHNALTQAALEELAAAVDAATEPVVCLQGTGESFCVGADLDTVEALDDAVEPREVRERESFADLVRRHNS